MRADELKVGDHFRLNVEDAATLLAIDYSSYLLRGTFNEGWVPFTNLETGAVTQMSGNTEVIRIKDSIGVKPAATPGVFSAGYLS